MDAFDIILNALRQDARNARARPQLGVNSWCGSRSLRAADRYTMWCASFAFWMLAAARAAGPRAPGGVIVTTLNSGIWRGILRRTATNCSARRASDALPWLDRLEAADLEH